MDENINKLIFGKAGLKRIVGIECSDSSAEIFTQQEDGSVKSQFFPNRYWILASEKLDSKFIRLEGDLHYKWGKQYDNRSDWSKQRNIFRNNDIYSIWNAEESLMVKDGYTYFQDLELRDVSVLSFDIETTGLNPQASDAKVILISNTFRNKKGTLKKLFSYDEYETESDMLLDWCSWIREVDPTIITNHNIFGFDFNYLLKRAENHGIQLSIGRDGSALTQKDRPSSFRIDGSRDMEYFDLKCYGRQILDTMFLAYRHDAVRKKYESYGLKAIIKSEKLEKENRTFYDASLIRTNYKNPEEFKKIKEYCKDDSDDALALFDLMAPAYFYQCQSCTRSLQHLHQSASGALINGILVRSYLQEKHSIPKADELKELKGGISFGIPGIYRNLVKLDIKSAYPSQILRFQLHDKNKDPKANFYKVVKYFTEQRFYYKKMKKETGSSKWEDLDASSKIFINSSYGACSTNGLNFNSPEVAAKITAETRDVLDGALYWASGKNKDYWMGLFKEVCGSDKDESDE